MEKQTWVQLLTRFMMLTGISIISALMLLFHSGCSSSSNKQKNSINTALSLKWVQDSVGCKQLRSKELATQLIKDNHLMNDTKERFLEVFQAPNEKDNTKDVEILKYYFNTMCENGKLAPNSDKCYASFYFKSNKLVEMHFVCE
jgi:hypothetical protein